MADLDGRRRQPAVAPRRTPQPLFALPGGLPTSSTGAYSYDVSPDGRRILVSLGPGGIGNVASALPLTVVTNWTQLLKK